MKDPTPVAVASRSFCRQETLRLELLAQYENVNFNDGGQRLVGQRLVVFLR